MNKIFALHEKLPHDYSAKLKQPERVARIKLAQAAETNKANTPSASRKKRQPRPAMPLKYIAIGICAVYFIIYASWACTLPQLMAPDEGGRLQIVTYILNTGQLPIGDEEAIRSPIYGNSYAYAVYGSSLISLLFVIPVNIIMNPATSDAINIAARFSSVCLATGTVALCFPIGARVFRRPETTVLLSVLVGLFPQFVFLASYLNCDMMGMFASALTILCLLVGVERKWDYRACVYLGLALGVVALSYYFAYGAIVVSIVAYYATAPRARRETGSTWLNALLVKPLVIMACALLVAGWYFIRNFFIYDGDVFGRSVSTEVAELYAQDAFKPSVHQTPRSVGIGPLEMITGNVSEEYSMYSDWLEWTNHTLFGSFGYYSVFISDHERLVYYVIVQIGTIAGIISYLRKRDARIMVACILLGLFIPFALSVYYSWSSDYQPQGRYVMAFLAGAMILVARGWESVSIFAGEQIIARIAAKLGKPVPKISPMIVTLAIIAIAVFLFARIAMFRIIPNCVGEFGRVLAGLAY